MEKSKTSNRYSPVCGGSEIDPGDQFADEWLARAVRMVQEHQGSYETQSAAVAAIGPAARQGFAFKP